MPEPVRAPPAEGSSSDRRRRAQELLTSQRAQLDQLERALSERLQSITDEVARAAHGGQAEEGSPSGSGASAPSPPVEALREQAAHHEREVERLRHEQERARIEIGKLEQELRVRDALLAEAQNLQQARCQELAAASEQLNLAQAQLETLRKQHEATREELAGTSEMLAEQKELLAAQRRKAARQLKEQHAASVSQQEALAAATSQCSALSEHEREHEHSRAAWQAQLAEQQARCEAQQAELAQLRQAVEEAQRERQRLVDELARAPSGEGVDPGVVKRLESERQELTTRLAAAEGKLSDHEKAAPDAQKVYDLQRRFEMAVEDLREMKRANAELEAKLTKAKSGVPVAAGGGSMDWEAQKRRLLESLEADDPADEQAVADRQTIEGTIHITDQIVAQKDLEIAELKRMLEGQADSSEAIAVGAAAVADLLDRDELVRQEREKLKQVQAEWRDKIGRAEIDISVERAKVARERAELEERIRQYQEQQDSRAQNGETDPGKARGRWLARLGLKDLDDKR